MKSLDFNYSHHEVIFYILVLQYSNSFFGPSSGLSFLDSLSSFNLSLIKVIQSENIFSKYYIFSAS